MAQTVVARGINVVVFPGSQRDDRMNVVDGEKLARLTGFSPRSVTKWSQGEPPSPKQEKALVEMDRLLDGLSRVMEPSQVGRWLKQPNAAFDGSSPLQVVERGEADRIWRMLYDVESGQPG